MSINNPEDLKRRAEIERLLSSANVYRLRGELVSGEDCIRQVLELDPENRQAQELLADFLYARGQLDEAAEKYKTLLEREPRASLESKYAKTVLEIGEREHQKILTRDMLENPSKYTQVKRNGAIAVILSIVAPGFGHVYFGDYVKGLILLGIFLFSWIIVAFSPGTSLFVQQVGDYVKHPSLGLNYNLLNPLAILFVGVGVFTYIYALIDTAVIAGKSNESGV